MASALAEALGLGLHGVAAGSGTTGRKGAEVAADTANGLGGGDSKAVRRPEEK